MLIKSNKNLNELHKIFEIINRTVKMRNQRFPYLGVWSYKNTGKNSDLNKIF